MSEIIWGRVGYAIIGSISGLIYALVIAIVLYPFIQSHNILLMIEVFVAVFALAGLLSGELVFKSIQGCVYALYVLYGYIITLLAPAVPPLAAEDIFPQKRSGILFVSLGIFAGAICLFIIYL